MKIKVAKSAGFCFGVKRAVNLLYNEMKTNKKIITLGNIIHNEIFIEELREKGVEVINDINQLTKNDNQVLIIRAHGISQSEENILIEKGINYIDGTCPLVKKIHKIVEKESDNNQLIIVIGDASHPEIKGIVGRIKGEYRVINSKKEAEEFDVDISKKLLLVVQTTFLYEKLEEILVILRKKGYYNINVRNTICNETTKRQNEAARLAQECDAMLVIGGRSSSNTHKLYSLCKDYCHNTKMIQDKYDLEIEFLQSADCLGITAGASTPHNIIEEVQEECLNKVLNKC